MIVEKDAKSRRGDVRESDGKIFWANQKKKMPDGRIYECEYWATPERFQKLKDKVKKYSQSERHKKYQQQYEKEYSLKNKERIAKRRAAHRQKPEVKERLREYYREYRSRPENKEKIIFWRNKHKRDPESMEKRKKRYLAYYSNPEVRKNIAEKRRARENARIRKDPEFLIKRRTMCRIWKSLRRVNVKKSMRTVDLIGCSYAFLREHIEKQFKGGMTWDKINSFHIDHIRPLSSFDLTDPKQLMEAFHWTNLQPLTPKENIYKRDKLDWNPTEDTL